MQVLEASPATYSPLIYVTTPALSQDKNSGKSVTTKEVMYRAKFCTSTDATKMSILYIPSPMRNGNGLHVLVSNLVALLKLGLWPLFFFFLFFCFFKRFWCHVITCRMSSFVQEDGVREGRRHLGGRAVRRNQIAGRPALMNQSCLKQTFLCIVT